VSAISQKEPPDGGMSRQGRPKNAFSPWNLLLVVPLLMLITPWFNRVNPKIIGVPFFYWSQLAFVPIGVVAVAIAVIAAKRKPGSVDGGA
jgi:hypothetical protein